jgi:8-oxo-dGTP diphosphatase
MPRASQAELVPVVAVGAVVVDRARRVLLVRRARAPAAGTWTLPGGHLEDGESLEAAIVREVREETALRTQVVCTLGVVPIAREGFAYTIHEHLLVPLEVDAPLFAGDDAAEARWVERAELEGFGVLPDAIEVIERGLEEAVRSGLTSGTGAGTGAG